MDHFETEMVYDNVIKRIIVKIIFTLRISLVDTAFYIHANRLKYLSCCKLRGG